MTAPDVRGGPASGGDELGFIHVYRGPTRPDAPVLLLLHGTGGDEHDLLPLGRAIDPGAGVLSPRGQVLERGMPRFFRRIAEGVFDVDDLKRRAGDLATFVARAREHYGVADRPLVAVGFSNGANIAGGILLLHPVVFDAAVLILAMVPFVPDPLPKIDDTPVLIRNGRHDPTIPAPQAEKLATLLRSAGARVELEWDDAGHQLTEGAVTRAREWISSLGPSRV